ncbi:MAG: hypothetical protein ACRDIU_10400, partial [Actinomycetota bacterium]
RAREPAGQAIRTAELFAPSTGGWKATAIMHFARYDHPLVNITGTPEQCGQRCGKVLASGGTGERSTPAGGEPQATAEYYSSSQPPTQEEPPPDPGDDPVVGQQTAGDQAANQPASTRQNQPAAPPPPAPPAPLPGAPATLASGSPLSVTNPAPGPLAVTSLMQSAAGSAASSLIYRQQPSSAQPAVPEAESSQQHDAAERFAMVMLGQSTFRIWFAVAITAIFGCIIASARATAAGLCVDPRPAWAAAVAGSATRPRD